MRKVLEVIHAVRPAAVRLHLYTAGAASVGRSRPVSAVRSLTLCERFPYAYGSVASSIEGLQHSTTHAAGSDSK